MMDFISDIHFASPWWFLSFGLIPFMVYFHYFKFNNRNSDLIVSDLSGIKGINGIKEKIFPYLPLLKILTIILFIIAFY